MLPLSGPPMIGQNAYTPEGVGDTEPVSPPKSVDTLNDPFQWIRSAWSSHSFRAHRLSIIIACTRGVLVTFGSIP